MSLAKTPNAPQTFYDDSINKKLFFIENVSGILISCPLGHNTTLTFVSKSIPHQFQLFEYSIIESNLKIFN